MGQTDIYAFRLKTLLYIQTVDRYQGLLTQINRLTIQCYHLFLLFKKKGGQLSFEQFELKFDINQVNLIWTVRKPTHLEH